MNKNQDALLFLARAGMELCWLYACATFLMTAIMHRPFPLPEAIGSFILALSLDRVVRGMGFRVISILGLQIMGFILAASRVVYTLYYRAYPYFDQAWIAQLVGKTRNSAEWLILVISLIFVLVFWLAGVAFARRSSSYLSVIIRFDYGVTAFFCLFIFKSLLLVKGGIDVRNPAPVLLLFPFFLFSLSAIGLTRNIDKAQKNFLTGYRGISMFLSFTAIIFAFGAGLVLFFISYLSLAAEAGYGFLKTAAGPLLPILERVLRFLFGKQFQQDAIYAAPNTDKATYLPSGESGGWSEILAWVGVGLLVLIGFIVCALAMWYLLQWLLSRTSKEERKPIHWQTVLLWAQKLWAVLINGFKWMVHRLKGYRDAIQLYRAFLRWGRRSGLPRLLSETPAEYGSRLQKQFPFLTADIGRIIEAYNLKVYAEIELDNAYMTEIKRSWKRLCSTLYWPARLKSWFLRQNA